MKTTVLHIAAMVAIAAMLPSCGQRQAGAAHSNAGALAKLKLEDEPKNVPSASFIDGSGKTHDLAEFRGHYVLVNLWATWCAPCVRELPALGHLQAAVGPRAMVVPVNVGRGTANETAKFLKDHGAVLPVYLDTKNAFLHSFGAFGLPLTILVDPHGREIARAIGAVRWDAPESIAYFTALGKTGTAS